MGAVVLLLLMISITFIGLSCDETITTISWAECKEETLIRKRHWPLGITKIGNRTITKIEIIETIEAHIKAKHKAKVLEGCDKEHTSNKSK